MADTDHSPPPERSRDEDFDFVFASEKRRLYQLAYSVLRDRGEAEDAVQDTMYNAWKSWDSLRDPSRRSAWLSRICLNQCFRDKGKRRADPTDQLGSAFEDLGTAPLRTGRAKALGVGDEPSDLDLDAAYRRLPLKQRAALLLHYHYGYTIDQCGELMGCRSGTVRTHVNRALARLRLELRDA